VDGPVLRIAMWSGPRTISTTLLRAWGNRDDTVVVDESLYLEAVTALGHRPPVLDASDVLAAPEPMLRELCRRLGVPFSDRMLFWPSGSRDSDGVWARWWYDAVITSTGFEADRPPARPLPSRLEPLLAACRPHYERLHRLRIRIDDRSGDAALR
jgi:hypothetical protein